MVKQAQFDQPEKINPQRLDEEIRAVLGEKYKALETGQQVKHGFATKTCIFVATTDDVTENDEQAIQAVIAAHNPDEKSAGQLFNEQRKQAIEALKVADLDADRAKLKTDKEERDYLFAMLKNVQLWLSEVRND